MTELKTVLESVLNWLRLGYPDGIPTKDYQPLLALLSRSLTEDEIKRAALEIITHDSDGHPVTPEEIEQAIRAVSDEQPTAEELNQVAARLASVGWPLAHPA